MNQITWLKLDHRETTKNEEATVDAFKKFLVGILVWWREGPTITTNVLWQTDDRN